MSYKPQQDMVMTGEASAIPDYLGNNADDIGRLYLETDTGIVKRWSGTEWEEFSSGGEITYTWDESTTTAGVDQNRSTAATNLTFLAGRVQVFQPLKLTAVLWDIRTTGDYKLALTYGTQGADKQVLVASQTVGSAGEITFDLSGLSPELILIPDKDYFFKLTRLTGAAGWYDYDAASHINAMFRADLTYYDSTYFNTFSLPIKLTGYKGVES